jgi:hypothetical protein
VGPRWDDSIVGWGLFVFGDPKRLIAAHLRARLLKDSRAEAVRRI